MHVNKAGLDFFIKLRLCFSGIMLLTDECAAADALALVVLKEEQGREEG